MTEDRFDWLPKQQPPAPLVDEHLCEFWRLRGATGRDITCAACRVRTGIELRVAYSAEEMIGTKLYRAPRGLTSRWPLPQSPSG